MTTRSSKFSPRSVASQKSSYRSGESRAPWGESPETVAAILQRRARALARPLAAPETPVAAREFVVFRLQAQLCAIQAAQVREIFHTGQITALPGLPTTLRGLTNLRGEIVPVFDLRPLLQLAPAEARPRETVLLAVWEEKTFGLLVDELLDARTLDSAALRRDMPGLQAQFLQGLTADGLLVLDLAAAAAALTVAERAS